jgi:hypothetical protein
MFRMLILLTITAMLALAAPAQAAKLKDLGWLEGHWAASGESHVEEIWNAPRAGTMTGMFRLIGGEKLRVLEYMVISEEKDGVFFRFKHFRADYSTWEGDGAPLTLKLQEAKEGRAVFRNTIAAENQPSYISYLLGDDGALTILVGGPPDEADKGETLKFVLIRQ